MKNVFRTLTITGGLAASLLIGAGSTSAAENDSLLNLNDVTVEKIVSADKSITVNVDGNAELKSETVLNKDVVASTTENTAKGTFEAGVESKYNATAMVETLLVDETVSSSTEAEGTIGAGVQSEKSSTAVDTNANARLVSGTVVKEDIVSSKTKAVAEGDIGADVKGEDSSALVTTNSNSELGLKNDNVSVVGKSKIDANLNSVVSYENSCSFLEMMKMALVTTGIESNVEYQTASSLLGTEAVSNLDLSSTGTESAKVMAAGISLIETQSTEVVSETDVNITSEVGLESGDVNTFSSALNAAGGLGLQSTDSSELESKLIFELATISELNNQ
ncbi:MAG: hypothetical protein ACE3JQ_02885 [Paenisporosarcina sp.]